MAKVSMKTVYYEGDSAQVHPAGFTLQPGQNVLSKPMAELACKLVDGCTMGTGPKGVTSSKKKKATKKSSSSKKKGSKKKSTKKKASKKKSTKSSK